MRINKIEISKFMGFYDTCVIDLHRRCKNLLVYGENGSGKSSLVNALQSFLDSSTHSLVFNERRNIFAPGDDGHIKLTLRENNRSGESTYEWSSRICETDIPVILDATKAKGFLDYKSLLETYFVHHSQNSVNLFDLLINNLLANSINDSTNNTFLEDWQELQSLIPDRHIPQKLEPFENKLQEFNQGLASKLSELQIQVIEILRYFEYDLEVASLEFNGVGYNYADKISERKITGQEVNLKISFFNRSLSGHHLFLNEAKLSAIALSIYLASLLLIPSPQLKLLVLDDVLIGLDMSNRLPIIEILENFFSDYQKIITTYDRNWFEMVRLRTADADWKYIEFYSGRLQGYEIPIYVENQDYLDKARTHLLARDYKACAVYVRSAFEVELKKLVIKKRLKVPYSKPSRKLSSQDFWNAIKQEDLLQSTTIQDIETYRKFILNPLSHSELTNAYERELKNSITSVEKLSEEIQEVLSSENAYLGNE